MAQGIHLTRRALVGSTFLFMAAPAAAAVAGATYRDGSFQLGKGQGSLPERHRPTCPRFR
jgi:hypothetical protein